MIRSFAKLALAALVLSLVNCTTPEPQAPQLPQQFSLFELEIEIQDAGQAAQDYRGNLGFQVQQQRYVPLSGGSRLNLSPAGSRRPSSDPGVRSFTIRITRLDQFQEWLKSRQIEARQQRITDRLTRQPATVFDFPDSPNLKPIKFIYFDNPYYVDAQSSSNHLNTAYRLQEIWIVVDSLDMELQTFASLGMGRVDDVILQPLRVKARRIALDRGELVFVQRSHLEARDQTHLQGNDTEIIGASLRIQNVQQADRTVARTHTVQYATTRYNSKSCVLIPPDYSHGVWLELARYSP